MMGHMKNLDIRIRMGGDDAIAAACEMSDLADERRGYEAIMQATGDITDIVTVLRGVGFSALSPQAGDSASLLHFCVTHAADEIERLRMTKQEWKAVEAILDDPDLVLGDTREPLRGLLERMTMTMTHFVPRATSQPPPAPPADARIHRENDHIPDTGKMVTTLTNDERAAIAWFSQLSYGEGGRVPDYAATLRRLLERMA